jgi:hypothetical protein
LPSLPFSPRCLFLWSFSQPYFLSSHLLRLLTSYSPIISMSPLSQ